MTERRLPIFICAAILSVLTVCQQSLATDLGFGEALAVGDDFFAASRYSQYGQGAGEIFIMNLDGTTRLRIEAPEGVERSEGFGRALAVSGNQLFVGSPLATRNGVKSGAVYVYEVDSGNLIDVLWPTSPQQNEHFGMAISASETGLAVGSPIAYNYRGRVHWYPDLTQATNVREIFAPLFLECSGFGSSILISGDSLLVGAPNGPGSGRVFLWENGILHRELARPTLPSSARFGSTLAVHEDKIFVGASNDLDGDVRRGSVYAYSFTDPAFVHRVDFSNAVQFLDLGMSMASSGGIIYVGCSFIGVDGYTGGAFVVDSETFGVVEMISSGEAAELQIGRKIAASSDQVVFADPGFYYRLWNEESGLCYILDGATDCLVRVLPDDVLDPFMTCIATGVVDWNDKAAWDQGRTPVEGDRIRFRVPGTLEMDFSSGSPLPWTSMDFESGDIILNLGDGSLAELSSGLKEWYCRIDVGSRSGDNVSVRLNSGRLVDSTSGVYDSMLRVRSFGGGSSFQIGEHTVSGDLLEVVVLGGSDFHVDGDLRVSSLGRVYIDLYSTLDVSGSIVCANFADVHVEGEAVVRGSISGNESNLEVAGRLVLDSTGSLYGMYIDGGGVIVVGERSHIRTEYVGPVTFDMSDSGSAMTFDYVGYCCNPVFGRTVFVYDTDVGEGVPAVSIYADDLWGFVGSQVVVSSDQVMGLGQPHLVGKFVAIFPPDFTQLSFTFESDMSAFQAYVGIGVVSSTEWGIYAVRTPQEWNRLDLTMDGSVNFFDVSRFLSGFAAGDFLSNINNDFQIDFFDVADFLSQYAAMGG